MATPDHDPNHGPRKGDPMASEDCAPANAPRNYHSGAMRQNLGTLDLIGNSADEIARAIVAWCDADKVAQIVERIGDLVAAWEPSTASDSRISDALVRAAARHVGQPAEELMATLVDKGEAEGSA